MTAAALSRFVRGLEAAYAEHVAAAHAAGLNDQHAHSTAFERVKQIGTAALGELRLHEAIDHVNGRDRAPGSVSASQSPAPVGPGSLPYHQEENR